MAAQGGSPCRGRANRVRAASVGVDVAGRTRSCSDGRTTPHTRFGKPRSCALTLGEFSRLDAPILGTLLNTHLHPWGDTPTVLPQDPRPCVLSFGSTVVTANPGLRTRRPGTGATPDHGAGGLSGAWPRPRGNPSCDASGGRHGSHCEEGESPHPQEASRARRRGRQRQPKIAPPPALLSAHAPGRAFGVSPSQISSVLCIRPPATENSR